MSTSLKENHDHFYRRTHTVGALYKFFTPMVNDKRRSSNGMIIISTFLRTWFVLYQVTDSDTLLNSMGQHLYQPIHYTMGKSLEDYKEWRIFLTVQGLEDFRASLTIKGIPLLKMSQKRI